jgi:hypothetical protein
MNLRDLSEINFGLVLEQRVPPTLYKPEWFCEPFNSGLEILMKPGATREDVAKKLSVAYLNDAHDAVKRMNGLGETENFDWAKSLRVAYENAQRGAKLKRIAKRLEENEDVDILPLYSELGSAIANESFGLRPASEIDYKTYKPFMPCGYEPIDKTLGGIPSDGPIIVYGLTGVGKSKFATALVNGFLHQYPEKRAAVFTLEMNAEHWLWRTMSLFPTMKDVLPRLNISGQAKDIEDVVAQVTQGKYDIAVLDDMDNMVKSSDASEYERIYRRVKEVCRFLGIPFIVLGQPNRTAKIAVDNGERFLSKYDVAWSGSAENSAALQVALQTTNGLDMKSQEFPTADESLDYLIFWKSRDGWPGDYDPKLSVGPGAVVMSHSANWQGNPYGKKWKLWPVNSGGKAIGKEKRKRDE